MNSDELNLNSDETYEYCQEIERDAFNIDSIGSISSFTVMNRGLKLTTKIYHPALEFENVALNGSRNTTLVYPDFRKVMILSNNSETISNFIEGQIKLQKILGHEYSDYFVETSECHYDFSNDSRFAEVRSLKNINIYLTMKKGVFLSEIIYNFTRTRKSEITPQEFKSAFLHLLTGLKILVEKGIMLFNLNSKNIVYIDGKFKHINTDSTHIVTNIAEFYNFTYHQMLYSHNNFTKLTNWSTTFYTIMTLFRYYSNRKLKGDKTHLIYGKIKCKLQYIELLTECIWMGYHKKSSIDLDFISPLEDKDLYNIIICEKEKLMNDSYIREKTKSDYLCLSKDSVDEYIGRGCPATYEFFKVDAITEKAQRINEVEFKRLYEQYKKGQCDLKKSYLSYNRSIKEHFNYEQLFNLLNHYSSSEIIKASKDSKGFYELLGFTTNSENFNSITQEEIRTAYKKKALIYHPNKQHNKSKQEKLNAVEMFLKVDEAYTVLSNNSKKQIYDTNTISTGDRGNELTEPSFDSGFKNLSPGAYDREGFDYKRYDRVYLFIVPRWNPYDYPDRHYTMFPGSMTRIISRQAKNMPENRIGSEENPCGELFIKKSQISSLAPFEPLINNMLSYESNRDLPKNDTWKYIVNDLMIGQLAHLLLEPNCAPELVYRKTQNRDEILKKIEIFLNKCKLFESIYDVNNVISDFSLMV